MSAVTTGAVPEMPSGSLIRKIAWHWRYDEKRELWIGWWTLVVFYNLYGLLFFVIARTQPPPKPSLDPSEIVQWFDDRRYGLLYGYAIVSIVGGATAIMNATLAYTMRRMSVSRAFASESWVAVASSCRDFSSSSRLYSRTRCVSSAIFIRASRLIVWPVITCEIMACADAAPMLPANRRSSCVMNVSLAIGVSPTVTVAVIAESRR